MPFFTRNPSYYISALQEETTEPLHIGLYLEESAARNDAEEQAESAITAESSWAGLATAIQRTPRSVRCMWLRAKNEGEDDRNGNVLTALRALGQGLVGATAVESLVLEDQGVGMDQLSCLREYLTRNTSLRGIKFLRTRLDAPSSLVLNEFLAGNSALRVLDLTANAGVDDEAIRNILGSISQNDRGRLETLNIFEELEGEADANIRITESGINFIAAFVSQTTSLSNLRLRIRELGDTGLGQLANFIKREDCKIVRLEICGRFGDRGILSIAEALTTNQSLRTIDIDASERLTDPGGQAILQVVQGQDESWQSKTKSNHTLQNVYISERAGSLMSKNLLAMLQSITTVDPHRTLRNKAWSYIDNNIEDLSSIGVDVKLAPRLLSFVSSRGGVDSLFRFLHSRSNPPELFSHPTPERVRLTPHMEKVRQENKVLRALLKSERKVRETIHRENVHLHNLDEDERCQRKGFARCLLLPLFKAYELCNFFRELFK